MTEQKPKKPRKRTAAQTKRAKEQREKRRLEREAKKRAEKKALFLDLLREGATVADAVDGIKSSRQTVYRWRNEDEEFDEAWEDAVEKGTDELEKAARDRALKGSDTLLIFLLKARRPEYRGEGSGKGRGGRRRISFVVEEGGQEASMEEAAAKVGAMQEDDE